MKFNIKYVFLFCLVLLVLIPSSCKAISYNTWKSNLEKVADTIQKKNYSYDTYCEPTFATYSEITKKKNLIKPKDRKKWLKSAKDSKGKYYKNYYTKTDLYKYGAYCTTYFLKKDGCYDYNSSKYWQKSVSNCERCVQLDCTKDCTSGHSSLSYNNCIKNLTYNLKRKDGSIIPAKNPYQRKKYCKDIVGGYNKIIINDAYNRYLDKIGNKNYKKLVDKHNYLERGMCCHDYVKFALQKSGVYTSRLYHAHASKVDDYNGCKDFNNGKFEVFVPEIGNKKGVREKDVICYTKQVSWLNRNSDNKRPLAKTLAKKGYLKPGDIISQDGDGTKQHSQVFMGYDAKRNKITLMYGVGKEYQTNKTKKYFSKFSLSPFGDGFLIKDKILSTQKDTRNDHDNPRVGAIIRLKGVN